VGLLFRFMTFLFLSEALLAAPMKANLRFPKPGPEDFFVGGHRSGLAAFSYVIPRAVRLAC